MSGFPTDLPENRIASVRDVLKSYAANYPVNHRRKSVLVVQNRSVHLDRLMRELAHARSDAGAHNRLHAPP